MNDAIKAAQNEASPKISKIAQTFQVSRLALSGRGKGEIERDVSPRRRPHFSQREETIWVDFFIESAELGFGSDFKAIQGLLRKFLAQDPHQFSSDWFQYFMERNPEIAKRRAEALSKLKSQPWTKRPFIIIFRSYLKPTKSAKSYQMEKVLKLIWSFAWIKLAYVQARSKVTSIQKKR